jgi:hypothetical protein
MDRPGNANGPIVQRIPRLIGLRETEVCALVGHFRHRVKISWFVLPFVYSISCWPGSNHDENEGPTRAKTG